MQELCDIDLIDSVHDRKMKLIQEEKRKEIERKEKEILRLEKKRKEEERKRKAEKEALARIEQENLNHRKRLEKIAMNKKINISLSNVEILKMDDEIEKDIINIKDIEFKKVNEDEIIDQTNHFIFNNNVDNSFSDKTGIDMHMEQMMDHDEDYENEDPEDEEDIENEITDDEILEKEKEYIDEYDGNRISSASSLSKSSLKISCFITSSTFSKNLSVISILSLLITSTNNLLLNYISSLFIL